MMAAKKKEVALTSTGLPADYPLFLESLKSRVRQSQTKAMLSVNRELIQLYWDIGRLIVERQDFEGWGKSVVERLASDLQTAFPGIQGFSKDNIWRMRMFYLAYRPPQTILAQPVPELEQKSQSRKVAQPVPELLDAVPPAAVASIPWGHNVVLMQKVKDQFQRLWYAAKTMEHGWSRTILTVQIESSLFERQGKAVTNFTDTLSPSRHQRLLRAMGHCRLATLEVQLHRC